MGKRFLVLAIATAGIAAVSATAGGGGVFGHVAARVATIHQPAIPAGPRLILPVEKEARHLLETTPRHIEWIAVPYGSRTVLAFVVSPERADRAPVVLVTARNQGASDWVRAIADQAAAAGFIAVVPDVLTGVGPKGGDTDSFHGPAAVARALATMGAKEIARRTEAVRTFEVGSAASNGIGGALNLDVRAGTIHATVNAGVAENVSAAFPLNGHGLPEAVAFLKSRTHDHAVLPASHNMNEHAEHLAMLAQAQRNHGEVGRPGEPGGDTSYYRKRPDLPADWYTAQATLDNSKLRKEWVNLKVGDVNMRTWIEYPAGTGKAGTVIVMQHGAGLDNWVRSVADQLSQSGFIAVAPDAWAGTSPDGGGFDTFQYIDDAMKAAAKVTPDETMRRFKAARDYALSQPRANGKSASIGFCQGGGNSFRLAGEVRDLNGAVVFYGTPPDEGTMAQINAPVIGFYGENDARVTATVESTMANMKRLGKSYEAHIYPKTTHSFVVFQEVGGNPAAINDAWPRVIAFLKKQLI